MLSGSHGLNIITFGLHSMRFNNIEEGISLLNIGRINPILKFRSILSDVTKEMPYIVMWACDLIREGVREHLFGLKSVGLRIMGWPKSGHDVRATKSNFLYSLDLILRRDGDGF